MSEWRLGGLGGAQTSDYEAAALKAMVAELKDSIKKGEDFVASN